MRAAALTSERRWVCPNCTVTAVTYAPNETKMHHCVGLVGMWVPMVPAGQRCKVELVERGDYVGGEVVRTDMAGRPWMAVRTTRDDGFDTAVYAPMARGTREDV